MHAELQRRLSILTIPAAHLCKSLYVMDLILPLAALLLIGFASFGLHRKILPRYSQTVKLWVTLVGATLLAILFIFAPG